MSCCSSQSIFNFVFSFESGIHGDDLSPFDGPGGTLGRATLPEAGEAYFDDGETWTINDISGK